MHISRWERLAALSGLAAGVFLVAASLIQGLLPDPDAAAPEVASFFADNDESVMAAIYARLVAGLFFMWFLGALRSSLARAEGDTGRLAAVSFGAGIVVLGFSGSASALLGGLAHRADQGIDGDLAATVLSTVNVFYVLSATALGWMLLAAFFVVLRTRVYPRWVGWLGLAVALENIFVPPFFFGEPVVLAGHFLALVWVAIVSVVLYRRPALAGPAVPVSSAEPSSVAVE